MENTSATLTVKELAEYLSIGKNTAYSLIHAGAIESFRIGNQIRIPKVCVEEWMLDQVTKPKTPTI